MKYRVLFSPEARQDLIDIYSGERRALGTLERIEAHCAGFQTFPERGTRRDDIRPGLRISGFERRVTIAFHVTDDSVIFDRFIYAGRSVDLAFEETG